MVTDKLGAKVQGLTYFPYGGTRSNTDSIDVHHKYTSQELDDSTGLYFYNARYYDPALGRFISADTIVPNPRDPQALNRYSYVRNNPIIYTDPSGHGWWSDIVRPIVKIVGGAALIAVSPYCGPAAAVCGGAGVALMASGVEDAGGQVDVGGGVSISADGDSITAMPFFGDSTLENRHNLDPIRIGGSPSNDFLVRPPPTYPAYWSVVQSQGFETLDESLEVDQGSVITVGLVIPCPNVDCSSVQSLQYDILGLGGPLVVVNRLITGSEIYRVTKNLIQYEYKGGGGFSAALRWFKALATDYGAVVKDAPKEGIQYFKTAGGISGDVRSFSTYGVPKGSLEGAPTITIRQPGSPDIKFRFPE